MQNQEEFDTREMVKALFGVADLVEEKKQAPLNMKEFTSLELSHPGTCPICDNQVRKDYEDFLDYTLCEYRYVCDRCGLASTYAYGNYETHIDDFVWGYTHNTNHDSEEMKQEQKEQETVARLYRKLIVQQEELSAEEDELMEELSAKTQKRCNGEWM